MGRLTDGHPTIISLTGAGVTLFEVDVTPPGYDMGGPNDTTTMRNIVVRTRQPKHLFTLTEMESTVQYDPLWYFTLLGVIGINDFLAVEFSDGSVLEFWGWLDSCRPNSIREGEPPTMNIRIVPSNQDDNGIEQVPQFTPGV